MNVGNATMTYIMKRREYLINHVLMDRSVFHAGGQLCRGVGLFFSFLRGDWILGESDFYFILFFFYFFVLTDEVNLLYFLSSREEKRYAIESASFPITTRTHHFSLTRYKPCLEDFRCQIFQMVPSKSMVSPLCRQIHSTAP